VKHALIIGSSGITGYPLSRHLLLKDEWKVSGLTRKPYRWAPHGLDLVHADLLDEVGLKKTMEGGNLDTVTHVFFTAWVSRGSEDKDIEDNLSMANNLLNALEERKCKLEFVYMQTGSKYYGMDSGPAKGMHSPPWKEHYPRMNYNMFYYPIEDCIAKRAESKGFHYAIGRPPCIIGFTANNAMNFGNTLAVYASLSKALNQPLTFSFGDGALHAIREFVGVDILCRFIIWVTEHPHAWNQAFNIANGDVIRSEKLFEITAKYFGISCEGNQDENRFDFLKGQHETWNRIVHQNGLDKWGLNELCTWEFFRMILNRDWDEMSHLQKLRDFGFRDSCDTETMFYDFFDGLKNRNVIPKDGREMLSSEYPNEFT